MTTNEQLCITKLFFLSIGMLEGGSVTRDELKIACEALKKLADQRSDWNEQQREYYKWLVDIAKETMGQRR